MNSPTGRICVATSRHSSASPAVAGICYLDNGIVIKLPEDGVQGALARLAKMNKEENLLARDIAAVDLRLEDRTAIELTPEAAERRQAAVDARTKALKKAGQDT